MARKGLLFSLRMVFKADGVKEGVSEAESAIKGLDKTVSDSNASQAKAGQGAATAAGATADKLKDAAGAAKAAGDAGSKAFDGVAEGVGKLGQGGDAAKSTLSGVGSAAAEAGQSSASGALGVESLAGGLKGLGKIVGGAIIATALTELAAAAGRFVGDSIRAFNELQTASQNLDYVFQGQAENMRVFGENAAATLGLSKAQFQTYAADVGFALQGINVPMDQLGIKTQELMTGAADLAATFGGTVPEAISAMISGVESGGSAMEAYRLRLTDADVEQWKVAKGAQGMSDEQARLAMIMEHASGVAGAYGGATNELAQQQAEANARFEDAKARLGEALYPLMVEVMNWLTNTGIPAFESFIGVISNMVEAFQPLIAILQTAIEWFQKLKAAADAVSPGGIIKKVGGFISGLNPFSAVNTDALPSSELGYADRTAATAGTRSSLNILKPTFNLMVSIDGQQLQGRISTTVASALAADGARYAAGAWT